MPICDRKGRPIQVGDVLKIFHYVHYRRREKMRQVRQILESVSLAGFRPHTMDSMQGVLHVIDAGMKDLESFLRESGIEEDEG